MRISDLRIGTRLKLSYAALLGLTLVLAAVGLNRLGHLSQALREVVVEQQRSQARVRKVNLSAEIAARKLLVLIGAPRQGRVEAYAAIDEANRRLDESVAELRTATVGSMVMGAFAQVEQRLAIFRNDYAGTIDLIEADDFEAARRMLGGSTESALATLSEALSAYGIAESEEIDQHTRTLLDLVRRDQVIVVALCLAALFLGLALAVVVTRSIVQPLARTNRAAQRIAAGQYDHRVPQCAGDEVGTLGRSLNQLAQAVAEREAARVEAAETETLTGLARLPRFVREGQALLANCDQTGMLALLICLDVDRLKSINAVLGFDAGDALLKALASRLRQACDEHSVLGRLSGGALVALLPISGADQVEASVTTLHPKLEQSFEWEGNVLDLGVTMGTSVYPLDGPGPRDQGAKLELLLRRAEVAMYEAKRAKVRSLRFDLSWESVRAGHLSLLSALRDAVEQDHLRQVLQPKVDAKSGELIGAEALVRWQHPQRGFMNPAEFIPFAEQTGRIRDLTRWMLRRAIRNLAELPNLQPQGRYLAVNISTLDLADQDLPTWLGMELATANVAPERLQLEVTESGLLAAGSGPVEVLMALRAVGVGLALDDFGTGHSSLAYLQRLPVQELKIDRSFVDKVDLDAKRQYLLAAIVDLGHSLGLKVTAEGVETEGELKALQWAGTDVLQGYLVSKPVDVVSFAAFGGYRMHL